MRIGGVALLRILLSFAGRLNLRGWSLRLSLGREGRCAIIVCEHVAFIYTVAQAHVIVVAVKLNYNTLWRV